MARLTVSPTVSSYQTWRFDTGLPQKECSAFSAVASAAGMRSEVCSNERFGSTYVLLEIGEAARAQELAAKYPGATAFDPAIIALAIEPEAQDALPALASALSGPGAPAGMCSAQRRGNAVLVEFSPERTAWRTVKSVIDAELMRFGSATRRTSLLSPLSLEMESQIAADGLQCPGVEPSRVLEALLADVDR